jgi:hypothetical protein
MTPQTAASMIVKVIPDGTEPADLLVLTDYQWEQLATQAGITAPAGARVAVGPDTRHQVAALLKGRRALPADPFADLPTY